MKKAGAGRVSLYARLLAEAADGGVISPRLLQLEDDILRRPGDCVEALAQFAGLTGGLQHKFASGYLVLIETWLLNLRLAAETGHAKAGAAIEAFQRQMAALAQDSDIDGDMFLAATMAMAHSGVPAAPDVEAAMAQFAGDLAGDDDDTGPLGRLDLDTALDDAASIAREDPFAFVGLLADTGHAMPVAAKAAMAAELAGREATAAAGLLMLLDPRREVREAAAGALPGVAGRLDGISLRRLIAIRNWLPDAERGAVDAAIRAARAAGVDCASWPEIRPEEINGSSLDGSGAQTFLITAREGRKRLLASILTRNGVRDAFVGPQTKAEIAATLSMARREVGMAVLSRHYLDGAVRHNLHAGLVAGLPPPAGLLEVAECIGASGWTPQAFDWRAELAALVESLPKTDAGRRRMVLEHSEFWAADDMIQHSWFEEGPHVADALSRFRRRDRGRATQDVLASVIEAARDKWAAHFTRVALVHHESVKPAADWQNFAILASALAEGAALADIPLMRAIAARTVEAAWER